MATTNDLKNGLVLNLDGELWAVVEFQHVKPGKGGAFVRTTLKNVLSGKVVDKTFNAGTKVETATVDKRTMQYLYADGEDYVFMDLETYDQIQVPGGTVGEAANYLLPEAEAIVATHEGVPLYVELPTSVDPRGHLHRAGPAGRPLDRRQQAGDRRDRRDRAGAAVHHHRREDQGRHPRRPLPRPRLMAEGPKHPMPARRKARKRALDVLYEADLRDLPPVEVLAGYVERLDRAAARITWSTRSAWSRASPGTWTGSTS